MDNICECGAHAFVPLSKGQVVLLSVADLSLVIGYPWYANYTGTHIYARNGELGYMHSVILGKRPKKREVDHINRDTLNNQRDNLRWATRTENALNCKNRLSKSGVRHIYFDKVNHCWYYQFGARTSRTTVSGFKTKAEAITYKLEKQNVWSP